MWFAFVFFLVFLLSCVFLIQILGFDKEIDPLTKNENLILIIQR